VKVFKATAQIYVAEVNARSTCQVKSLFHQVAMRNTAIRLMCSHQNQLHL